MHGELFRGFPFQLLMVTVIFVFSAVSIYAQLGKNTSGTGGKHTIQGSIFMPNGMRPDSSINVRLESTAYSALSVFADRNGSFSFTNLTPGSYTIVIEAGGNFEISKEYVYIDNTSSPGIRTDPNSTRMIIPENPRTVRVPIYLQFKRNAQTSNKILNAKLVDVPKTALKHYEKALELILNNKTEDSIAALQMAVNAYPQFSIALAELGKQYLKLGRLNEAVTALHSSVKINPKYFDAKLDYGIALLNKKEIDDAAKQLKDAIGLNDAAVAPHYYLALVYIQKQNLDEAQKELELGKKLASNKSFPQLHRMLGGIYWQKKQYKQAADELETYIQILPNTKEAKQIRGTIKELRNKN